MNTFNGVNVDELAALLALWREGSFVKAGRLLGRHSTIVSKRVASLENRLGVRLVERTTRQVRLTDAGERLAQQVNGAQQLIAEAEQIASSGATEVRGRLRLALPAAMGRRWLAPLLPDFMKAHPNVELDVHFSEQIVELVEGGFDAAIRVGTLTDSRLVSRKLAYHERILCASPDYVVRWGEPTSPADIARHNSLQFSGFVTYPEWRLSNGKRKVAVHARGTLISNDSPSLVEAAKAGLGILGVGEWLVTDEIAKGTLVRILPEWAFDMDGGVYLVRPSKHHTPAHVNAFCDWIAALFRDGPPWQRGGN
ncbi:LysR family transcriptional regulator (plasmid) [Rhizobium leguminosarum]